MDLKYRVKFLDYWHLSSGLNGGTKFDSVVVKDDNTLPYLPGKTIKGLVREMFELNENEESLLKNYGAEGSDRGLLYFTNAQINDKTKEQIVSNSLQDNLYDVIASTKIDKNGVAIDNSLREIEVVVPIELEGEILDIESEDDFRKVSNSLKMVKRMGLNRNRGLGRCKIEVIK